ncbi:YeeE/YedE family protein [Ancrocorticia populi]|uniref:YeeE/YedE family protein n=1 Tax=Ancrocorticia populi TaxID=2175228 RepID=UPI003F8EF1F6
MILTGLILGVVLGFVFQRGRFCVTGAFRDVWLSKSTRWLNAFLLAIAIQAVLVQVLASVGVISPEAPALAFAAVAVGSFLFGIGIVLSGGCATGTYYRSGEGLIGSWIALGLYAFTSAAMKYGVGADFTASLRDQTIDATTIHGTFGLSAWVPVIGFAALVAYLQVRQSRKNLTPPATLAPRKTGIAHVLFEKKWTPNTTAIIVGVLAALAFPLSQATGRNSGLGITTPSANIVQYLTTGQTDLIDWGVAFVLGIIPGSYIAAKGSGEFRLRAPDASTAVRAVFGGTIMGVGASLAGGCTIGNALVQTALFSWQGWIAFAFTFLGVGFAAKFFITRGRGAQAGADSAGASPALVQVQ